MVEVFRPAELDELLAFRGRHRATILAGGTDLMVRHRKGAGIPPSLGTRVEGPVLCIDRCDELKIIQATKDFLDIGAGASMAAIIEHPDVDTSLKEILLQIGAPGLRNVATIGGNICNASPAADTLPFLYAFDAVMHLRSTHGERRVPVDQFVTGPGKTALGDDEILVSIRVPRWSPTVRCLRKVGTRRANALTKVSFSGFADVLAGKVSRIALASGAVAPTVIRFRRAESRCVGADRAQLLSIASDLVDLCEESIQPIDDQRSTAIYRRRVAGNLIRGFIECDLAAALAGSQTGSSK
jgi:xanthine dehydrogenase FAD-binding subunit